MAATVSTEMLVSIYGGEKKTASQIGALHWRSLSSH